MSTNSEGGATGEDRLPAALARLARLFGLGFFGWAGLLALGAIQLYLAMAASAWGAGVTPFAWGVAGVVGLGAWHLGGRDVAVSLAGKRWLVGGLLLALLVRLAVSWWLDGPLVSDFQEYHDLAVSVVHGGPWFSELRPMGYPLLLAAGYALFGVQHWVGEAINVALAVALAGLLYAWVRRLAGPAAAFFALVLYAITPAHVLMVAVQGTEIPYATAIMATLLALSWVGWAPRRAVPLAALGGVLLGLSHYIRPTSVALVPAVLVYLWLAAGERGWRGALAPAAAFGLALLLVLAPVARWNWEAHHKVSLSTSTFGGWSLLVGTNQKSNGFWNADDLKLVAPYSGAAREAFEKKEALRRITGDPVGFAGLAVRKFAFLWAAEDYGTYWTMDVVPGTDRRVATAWYLASQAVYALLLWLAFVAVLGYRRLPAPVALVLMGLATLAGAHTFLEVQSRYHFYWTPLFAGLAGIGAERLWAWRREQLPPLSPWERAANERA